MRIIFLCLCLFASHTLLLADDSGVVEDVPVEEPASTESVRQKMTFTPPQIPPSAFFALYFSSPDDITTKLIKSLAKKDGVDEQLAKYDGVWTVEVPHSTAILQDYALVIKSKARHHAISAPLDKVIDFASHDQLVVQYEVKFQTPMECGGAYVKLLSQQPSLNLKEFNDKTPYTIMFGPDKCGLDHKLHFIFRHKNPMNGVYEEKHAKKPSADLSRYFTDQKSHLYTLVLNADNTFAIYVDQSLVNSGNLLSDFEPAVNPPEEIDDPADKKPADWDEREKIPDPNSQKPDDWDETQPEFVEDKDAVKPDGWLDDEPKLVPDPTSEKPSDWDTEMDGEWEAPKIDNPKCKEAPGCGPWTRPQIKNPLYKGKWSAPLIDNPAYKGIWKPKRVKNPHYFTDAEPYRRMTPISALGLELWSMTDEIAFDNFFISHSKEEADKFAEDTWGVKTSEERKNDPRAQSVVDAIQEATKDRPWIWGIVVLVVGLPIVLIVAYCCMRGGSSSPVDRDVGRRKKTDEPTPDVDDSGEKLDEQDMSSDKPVGKAALESSDSEAASEDEKSTSQAEEKVKEHLSTSEKSASSGEENVVETKTTKKTNKRQVRKE